MAGFLDGSVDLIIRCQVHSIFCCFGRSDQKTKKSAIIFKKNAEKTNRTADFFVFGHFDQNTKNGMNWTQVDILGNFQFFFKQKLYLSTKTEM